jgi:hypothetical protein
MGHPRVCESATKHVCVCSDCGGTLHGWPYLLGLARQQSHMERLEFRNRADHAWDKANKGRRRRKKPSKTKMAAATDVAVADIIDALADIIVQGSDTLTVDIIAEKIGNIVATKASDEVNGLFGLADRRDRKRSQAHHFWCDILAAFACAIEDLKVLNDRIPEAAASRVLNPTRRDRPPAAEETSVRLATKVAWKEIESQIVEVLLKKLPPLRQLEDLCRAIRILAIMMCPAPEDHRAVVQCCIKPLEEGIISAAVKQRLMSVLDQAGRL